MVDQIIRPADLPNRASPNASEKIPVDNGSNVAGATVESIVLAGRPTASQAEAEAGTDAVKAMTPLTVDQKIEYEIGRSIASKAQGDKADSAIQEIVGGSNTTVDNTDPTRPIISSVGGDKVYASVRDLMDSFEAPRGEGAVWQAQGFSYTESSPSATDFHIQTDGGVKLKILPEGGVFNATAWGIVGDGSDETALIVKAISTLEDWDTLDLDGLEIWIFHSVAGVTTGDAAPLDGVPRLYGKTGVTIRNGAIKAANPSVSGTKYRFPSTLTIDGCVDCRFERLVLQGKGESWGDTDASAPLTAEQRRAFTAQNGGHAFVIIRSLRTTNIDVKARLCGSVGSFYIMSSHKTLNIGCFSNPGSLGYAAYCADAWAGIASVAGFPAFVTTNLDCATSKEGYTYGSKGCVLSEDADVTFNVVGGFYADAYANGSARDLGYAFGCSSSQTIVNGAVVENCASLGYTAVTTTQFSYLYVANVHATGLRKTVHQCTMQSFSRMVWKYINVDARVNGSSGVWPGDGNLTREATSIVALPNGGNTIEGSFSQCTFSDSTYGIIATSSLSGFLRFDDCTIQTNGFLWNINGGLGIGSAGYGKLRGLLFNNCGIEDTSSQTGALTSWTSTARFVYVDLSTSTIRTAVARRLESTSIATPGTFVERYEFPRPSALVKAPSTTETLLPESAKVIVLSPSAPINLLMPQGNLFKYWEARVRNSSANVITVRDASNSVTYGTIAASTTALLWNDGANTYVTEL